MTDAAALPSVARIAGLPRSTLDTLAAPVLTRAVGDYLDAQSALTDSAPALARLLHDAVPCLDRDARRTVLGVRRRLHADPHADLPAADLACLDAVLPGIPAGPPADVPVDGEPLAAWVRWRAAARARDTARADLHAEAARLGEVIDAAASVLAEPATAQALAFASPRFATALLDHDGRTSRVLRPGDRFARSVTGYLTRTALKPSPFSALTTVTLAGPGPGDDAGPGTTPGTGPSSARSVLLPLLATLLHAVAKDARSWRPTREPEPADPGTGAAPRPDWGTVPAPLPGSAGTSVLVSQYCHTRGVWFRHDEPTALEPPWSDLLHRIEAGRASAEELADAVGVGLLTPRPPWPASATQGLEDLARAAAATALPEPVLKCLGECARAESRLAGADTAREVARCAEDLRASSRAALEELDHRVPAWWDTAPVVHELVAEPGALPSAPAADRVREVLGPVLRRAVRVSSTYLAMVELAWRTHGAHAVDALSFSLAVQDALDAGALGARPTAVPPGQLPRGHLSLARPATWVLHQDGPPKDGDDPAVVVNHLGPLYPGVVARWAGVPSLHDRIATLVDRLQERRHPGCRHYQWTASGDWTATQRPTVSRARWPRVGWGADLADPDVVPLSAFRVRVDPVTRSLQITDPEGRPASLGYAGAVPPFLLGGVPAVLAILADPWSARLALPPAPQAMDGPAPRVVLDSVVLRRRTWTFAPEQMPRISARDIPGTLLAIEAWRREHGLPDEVFVAAQRPGQLPGRTDKPAWLSSGHPTTAWSALAGAATTWVVTEALPDSRHGGRTVELGTVVEHG